MAVVDDDVDGVVAAGRVLGDAAGGAGDGREAAEADGAAGVLAQGGLGVDAAVDVRADAVVHGGRGEDFNLVVDGLDAGDGLDGIFGVGFEDGAGGVALQNDGAALDAEVEGVEDVVGGEAEEVFLNGANDAGGVLCRPGRGWGGVGGGGGGLGGEGVGEEGGGGEEGEATQQGGSRTGGVADWAILTTERPPVG